MTASIIYPLQDFASDPKYKIAKSILENRFPELPERPDLETIIKLSQQVIHELTTDIDFCDDKHYASFLALEWLFQELYQDIPLDRLHFFVKCEELIIHPTNLQEKAPTPWYNK